MSDGAGSAGRRRGGLVAVVAAALMVLAAPAAARADNDSWQEPFGVLLTDEPVTDSNFSATEQEDEPLTPSGSGSCGASRVKMVATKWYRFVGNGGRISVNTAGSDFDTVIAAYIGSTPRSDDPLPCSDDAPGSRTSALSFDSVADQIYLIQVGGCNACGTTARGNIVLNVHADPPPGTPPPATPPPPPPPPAPPPGPPPPLEPKRMNARSFLSPGTFIHPTRRPIDYLGLKVRSLVVTQVPAGTVVRISCSRTCTPRSKRKTAKSRRRVVFRHMNGTKLRAGTTIRITATHPDYIGSWIKYTILENNLRKVQRCLFPGDLKPDRC